MDSHIVLPLGILRALLESVRPALKSNGIVPILESILLQSTGKELVASSTDLDTWLVGRVAYAGRAFEAVISPRFLSFLDDLPDEYQVMIESNDSQVSMDVGEESFRMESMPARDFPRMPGVTIGPVRDLLLNGRNVAKLSTLLSKFDFDQEEFKNCLVAPTNTNTLSFYALGRYRVTRYDAVISNGPPTEAFSISASAAAILGELIPDSTAVRLVEFDDHIGLSDLPTTSGISLTALIRKTGAPLPSMDGVPSNSVESASSTFRVRDFKKAFSALLPKVVPEDNVRLSINGSLELIRSATNSSRKVPAENSGQASIVVRQKYLLEMINSATDKEVTLSILPGGLRMSGAIEQILLPVNESTHG